MHTLFYLLLGILTWYSYILTAYIIFAWLYSLNLLRNAPDFIHNIAQFIYSFVEPFLFKIRKYLPLTASGVDFSPFVLYLIIWVMRSLLYEYGPSILS